MTIIIIKMNQNRNQFNWTLKNNKNLDFNYFLIFLINLSN